MFHLIKWGFSYEELLNMPLTQVNYFIGLFIKYHEESSTNNATEE